MRLWKNAFTAAQMQEMEMELKNNIVCSLRLNAADNDLLEKLKLKVEYVEDMDSDNEAELVPINDDNFYGLIRVTKELKKYKFACIHEVMHYIFDVGYGNKVTSRFSREGKENSCEEQRINYMTTAFIMPVEQIKEALNKYDHSSPKMDETKFIKELMLRYEQSETTVIRRICEIRKLNKAGV